MILRISLRLPYHNMALQRPGSKIPPTCIAPIFLHGNSDFETYCIFFGHLSARFASCNFRELRVGSVEEQSIRKAAAHCFPGSTLVMCTRHLKERMYTVGNIFARV